MTFQMLSPTEQDHIKWKEADAIAIRQDRVLVDKSPINKTITEVGHRKTQSLHKAVERLALNVGQIQDRVFSWDTAVDQLTEDTIEMQFEHKRTIRRS